MCEGARKGRAGWHAVALVQGSKRELGIRRLLACRKEPAQDEKSGHLSILRIYGNYIIGLANSPQTDKFHNDSAPCCDHAVKTSSSAKVLAAFASVLLV